MTHICRRRTAIDIHYTRFFSASGFPFQVRPKVAGEPRVAGVFTATSVLNAGR